MGLDKYRYCAQQRKNREIANSCHHYQPLTPPSKVESIDRKEIDANCLQLSESYQQSKTNFQNVLYEIAKKILIVKNSERKSKRLVKDSVGLIRLYRS